MEYTQNNDGEISLKELFAVIIHRGYLVIIFAIVFALLLGSFGALNYYVLSDDPDRAYRIEMEAYKQEMLGLETIIEHASINTKHQEKYNTESFLMHIDPYNKYTTSFIFAISNIDTSNVQDSFAAYETPISYMTSRITAQYTALWNQLELADIVFGTSYEGGAEKYLREVISFSVGEGGTITLSAIGNDMQECETIVNNLYAYFSNNLPTVSSASYEHSLISLNGVVSLSSVDLNLEALQRNNQELLDNYNNTVATTKKEMLELEKKVPSYTGGLKSIVTNTIIGGILGCLLACVFLVVCQIFNSKILSAKQFANRYHIEYFGIISKVTGFWNQIASRIVGERVWKTEQQAYDYIVEMATSHLPKTGKIAIISTLETPNDTHIQSVVRALSIPGREILFACDFSHNPKVLKAIRESDGVVFAEQLYVTTSLNISEALSEISKLEKKVYGFVLI